MRVIGRVLVAASFLLAGFPALAHHSIEEQFDVKHPVELDGTVTKVQLVNPHMRVFVDVKDRRGVVANWEVDMGSPTLQMLRGLKIDTLRPGDHVTVKASPAKDGSKLGYAERISVTGR
jgi:hypothetical protein